MADALPVPTYRVDGSTAVITLDDGKVNVFSFAALETLQEHLDRAEADAGAVVFVGNQKAFSAGFDLASMRESTDTMRRLVTAGAELFARVSLFGRPTVAACTGHALAAGALLLLACDVRIGAGGSAKIGLNEVAIGMPLPVFAIELARERLSSPAALTEATQTGKVYEPAGAVEVGYLDRMVGSEDLVSDAVAEANRLSELSRAAYAGTKANLRGPMVERIRATLGDDMARVSGPTS